MGRLLTVVRAIVKPVMPQIVKKEPVIASAAAAAVCNLAFDAGLQLTGWESGLLATATMAVVGKAVRELVTPAPRTRRRRAS